MAGLAGKKALVKVSGAATAFTAEAFTSLGDNKTYQITNTAKRVWDPTITIVIKVGGSPTVESYTINRLTGTVTFATVDAGRGAVTADGSYLPMSMALEAKEFYYTITAKNDPDNSFGDDYVTRVQTTKDITGTLGRWRIDQYFRDALIAGSTIAIQFFADSSGAADLVCWALLKMTGVQAAQNGLQEEPIAFDGVTDADGRAISLP